MASSVTIRGLSMRIVIDGETFEFQNVADIENLPREKVVQILKYLLFVELPALLLEASKVPQLQQNIKKLTEEKEIVFKKSHSIEDLSAKIEQCYNQHEVIKKEILMLAKSVEDVNQLRNEVFANLSEVKQLRNEVFANLSEVNQLRNEVFANLSEVKQLGNEVFANLSEVKQLRNEVFANLSEVKQLRNEVFANLSAVTGRLNEVIQPSSAWQMATNAENAVMNAIFPSCRKKPYCLTSYRDLLTFLSKPESDELTGPFAPAAWLELAEKERNAIKTKAEQFVVCHPYLKVSIDILKSEAWKQTHSTTTVKETMKFYEGDEEACESVSVCAEFLGLTSAADKATENVT
eukprot:gene4541-9011_t